MRVVDLWREEILLLHFSRFRYLSIYLYVRPYGWLQSSIKPPLKHPHKQIKAKVFLPRKCETLPIHQRLFHPRLSLSFSLSLQNSLVGKMIRPTSVGRKRMRSNSFPLIWRPYGGRPSMASTFENDHLDIKRVCWAIGSPRNYVHLYRPARKVWNRVKWDVRTRPRRPSLKKQKPTWACARRREPTMTLNRISRRNKK